MLVKLLGQFMDDRRRLLNVAIAPAPLPCGPTGGTTVGHASPLIFWLSKSVTFSFDFQWKMTPQGKMEATIQFSVKFYTKHISHIFSSHIFHTSVNTREPLQTVAQRLRADSINTLT